MTRRELLQSATVSWVARPASRERTFWVFGLLHPRKLRIEPVPGARLHCRTAEREWMVEGGSSVEWAANEEELQVSGAGGAAAEFILEAPGLLRRRYLGKLQLRSRAGVLRPLVTVDCETATGSVVGAELPSAVSAGAALMAQAIAARSILWSRRDLPRHGDADFCDTTHCQFLRAPAERGSAVDKAVRGSRELVLWQGGRVIIARYSAACGGTTEAGLMDGMRYSPVACPYCRAARMERRGHGWGLCQEAAMAMAREGRDAREILTKYYPGTLIDTAC